jgi:hypothetical protein
MAQKAPNERLDRQAHRPLFRLVAWAFGPLFIPKADPLAITRDQPLGRNGSSAQIPRQVDQHPLSIGGIALPDMHVPRLAAQLVEQILHLLLALTRGQLERPVRQPLADGRSQLTPEDRHDHPPGQEKPVSHGHPVA